MKDLSISYIRRLKDDVVLEVPTRHLEETLKRGGFERLPETLVINQTPKPVGYLCPLCEKEFKSEAGLKVHKRTCKI